MGIEASVLNKRVVDSKILIQHLGDYAKEIEALFGDYPVPSFSGYYYIPQDDKYGTGLYQRQQENIISALGLNSSSTVVKNPGEAQSFALDVSNQSAVFISNPRGSSNRYTELVNALSLPQDIDGGSAGAKILLHHFAQGSDTGSVGLDDFHIHPTALSIVHIAKNMLLQTLEGKKVLMPGGGGNTGTVATDLFTLMGAEVKVLGRDDTNPLSDYITQHTPDVIVSLVPPIQSGEAFDLGELQGFKGSIIDVTTRKGPDGTNRGSFANIANKPANINYIPSVGNVGILTTFFLVLNYLRALAMSQDEKDSSLVTLNSRFVGGSFSL